MSIKFKVYVETGYVGCEKEDIIEIDEEDLRDVPPEDWDDYVWKHLGGSETAHQMIDMGCFKIE